MQSTVSIFLVCTLAAAVLAQQVNSEDDITADKRVRQFAFAKRSPYRTFAFAKRGIFDDSEDEEVTSDVDKRARFAFAKRGYRSFAFAKRSPYGFAFAKRGMSSFA